MNPQLSRRTALGAGAAAAATVLVAPEVAHASAPAAVPASTVGAAAASVADVYGAETRAVHGKWNSYITVAGQEAVSDHPDTVLQAYSVNKIAIALAVLDKVDRGLLRLDQLSDVTSAIVIADSDGIFPLDGAYPSQVTLGHVLTALLTVSDDTAVRLCGLAAPALEINQILADKGFPLTQVEPVANPYRMYMGTTTPRDMHRLLTGLVRGELLSAQSTQFLFSLLRSPIAFTDGIRRTMSSDERARIATKAGWFDDARHEAGIIFDTAGQPLLTYSIFASGLREATDFGATNPGVAARDRMGRAFVDIISGLPTGATSATLTAGVYGTSARPVLPARAYRPSNGG